MLLPSVPRPGRAGHSVQTVAKRTFGRRTPGARERALLATATDHRNQSSEARPLAFGPLSERPAVAATEPSPRGRDIAGDSGHGGLDVLPRPIGLPGELVEQAAPGVVHPLGLRPAYPRRRQAIDDPLRTGQPLASDRGRTAEVVGAEVLGVDDALSEQRLQSARG